jgi:hypothetical protein
MVCLRNIFINTLHIGDNKDDDDDDDDNNNNDVSNCLFKERASFFGRIRPLALTTKTA